MGRRPGQTCSLCDRGVSLKDSRDDGNGGRRCKPDCEARKAADVKASPPTAKALAKADKEAVARLAAHRVAVLDFLRPKSAGTSFSPGEIARGSGVLLEEIDAVIKALLASGEIEEMADEEDEDPTYRAKPAEPKPPAEKKPRVNRRGKPTVESEAARTCRVRGCGCSAGKSCDMGAGRTCCWTSADTPAEGDTCSLCAELIDAAEEAIEREPASKDALGGLATSLYENCDAPALGETTDAARPRLLACIEIAAARRTPSKKDRPRDTKKKLATVLVAPAQATLPHSEEARTLTLPMGREPLAVVPADRGACEACGTKLTPENSSRPPSGAVKHIGCNAPCGECGSPRGHVANGQPYNPHGEASSDLRDACETCGAAEGEPCAWATPEPASYVHEARTAKLPVEDRRALHRRATEDRIRVALDERVPGDPPMPSQEALVRSLVVPGDFDAPTLRDVLGVMLERGEVRELESDPIAGVPGAKYLRRAPGSPPVVMGRVGVAEKRPGSDALAEMDRAAKASCGCDHSAIQHTAEGCAACSCGRPPPALREADRSRLEAALANPETAEGAAAMLHVLGPPPAESLAGILGDMLAAGEAQFAPESPGESEDAAPFTMCPQCFVCMPKPPADVASILSERPDERLAAQLGAAVAGVEDLASYLRDAAESLAALRVELAEQREAHARELVTAKDLARLASIEAADAKDESRALRGALANVTEALGGTVPGEDEELISEAVGLARRSPAGGGALRGALHDVVGELGGELPETPTDEQLCVGAIDAASSALKAVTDLAGQVDAIAAERAAARSERDIVQGDARNMAGRVMRLRAFVAPLAGLPAPHEATDHELIAAAEQRVLPLVAAVEGAIVELTGASATSAKPIAEQLHEAVATFGPRAGDFSTELETAAVLAVHKLTGEPAPMGKGRVAIAEALTAAVEATAAKLAVRRMRVPGATPETGNHTRPRVVF